MEVYSVGAVIVGSPGVNRLKAVICAAAASGVIYVHVSVGGTWAYYIVTRNTGLIFSSNILMDSVIILQDFQVVTIN